MDRRNQLRIHHTATHLLHAALKLCIDKSISQAGSLVDTDRLRFDFSSPRSLNEEDLRQLEDVINRWIREAHETQTTVMAYDEAVQKGAVAMFNEKYEANVCTCVFECVVVTSLGSSCRYSWSLHGTLWWNACGKYERDRTF